MSGQLRSDRHRPQAQHADLAWPERGVDQVETSPTTTHAQQKAMVLDRYRGAATRLICRKRCRHRTRDCRDVVRLSHSYAALRAATLARICLNPRVRNCR
jgi:hypothetical protein